MTRPATTHRRVLALAGLLAERCAEIVRARGGMPAPMVLRFAHAADALLQVWSDSLPRVGSQPVREAMATSGVLLRVACTLIQAIGRRQQLFAATELAPAAMKKFTDFAQSVSRGTLGRQIEVETPRDGVDQFVERCDRLSDVLCGAMMPHTDGLAFAVYSERAREFSETFAKFPALVRVPVRLASGWCPAVESHFATQIVELMQALSRCFGGLIHPRRVPPDPFTDLAEIFCPRVLPFERPLPAAAAARPAAAPAPAVTFPDWSFAKLYAKRNPQM